MKVIELLQTLEHYEQLFPKVMDSVNELDKNILESEVTSIEHDSREVKQGSIFVAFEGTEFDSHSKISNARKNGALLVIGSKSYEDQTPDLVLDNSRSAIGPLCSTLTGDASKQMTIVGITGTNGKTTVSYLYSNMVMANGNQCFTMGTTGVLIDGEKEADSQTTPDPLLIQDFFSDFLKRGITHGALEVSSHALDQYRVLGTEFSAVAYTNFSQDHLDYHSSMDEYFTAKASLFSKTYSNKAVINLDDERSKELIEIAKKSGQEIILVSTNNSEADVYIEANSLSLTQSKLVVSVKDNKYLLSTDLIGDFNFENIAVAVGLSYATGLDIEKSIQSLNHPDLVPGRLQRIDSENNFSVFVDYAHTPDALKRVLDVVQPLAKRTIIIFGCGGDRDRTKRPLMGKIAISKSDIAIVTSDNPRSEDSQKIIAEIVNGLEEEFIVIPDRREAIRYGLKVAQQGDAVIIAGKGHESGQIFSDHIDEFSDMDVALELLKEMD